MRVSNASSAPSEEPGEGGRVAKRYWDWNCARYIPEKEYAVHDRLNHDLEEEGFQSEEGKL